MCSTQKRSQSFRLAVFCGASLLWMNMGTAFADPVSVPAGGNAEVQSAVPSNTGTDNTQSVSPATLGALANAQSEAALLKAQLEIAKLKAEIKKVQEGKSLDTKGSTSYPQGMQAPVMMPTVQPQSTAKPYPKVVSIFGSGNGDVAELSLPGGGTVSVRAGTSLAPWGTVSAVSGNGVYLDHHGKHTLLPFAQSDGASGGVAGEPFAGGPSNGGSFLPPSVTQGVPSTLPPVGVPPMPKE